MDIEKTSTMDTIPELMPKLGGDPPELAITEDAFGLDRMARAIAELLANRISADGYTIEIEGEWGSGKTSLTNFVVEELQSRSSLTLKVVRFEPWLVGKRQALLGDLFRGLRAKIEEFRADPILKDKLTDVSGNLIDRVASSLEKYQVMLEAGGKGVSTIATIDTTHHAKLLSLLLSGLNWLAKKIIEWSKAKTVTLEDLRESIKGDLRVLSRLCPNTRLIVIIDDVDRLEPGESMEILRLIRAVADFPLVTYLVCYDRTHLAKQIRTMVRVGDGYDYLQKIFQNIISVPPQEPFSLRRYTRKLLAERFPKEFEYNVASASGRAEREAFLFDFWVGKLIFTPRDAMRLAEAVTLGWPDISSRADFVDFIWLQLIKLQAHALYNWIRGYVVNVGSYRDGGRPGDSEPEEFAKKLREILKKIDFSIEHDHAGMQYFLPGVGHYVLNNKPLVFKFDNGELGKFETQRRLGSPSHWRLYFAFERPSYALAGC